MGILPFQQKKKKSSAPSSKTSKSVSATTSAPVASSNVVTPSTEPKTKWSPIRKLMTTAKTPASPLVGSVVPPTVPVVSHDRVEVMTLESQRALMEQREAIRKKLFESSSNHDGDEDDSLYTDGSLSDGGGKSNTMKRAATNASHEVTPSGKIRAAKAESPYDRFSIPIHPATSNSWDGSLQKLSEEPVLYSRDARSMPGPISVDHSFTESELASVISQRIVTPSSALPKDPQLATVESVSPDASSAAAVVSPANTTRSSIAPMDERVEDLELQKTLNTGKSPLKGMPDDERLEYQKDEMDALPSTPQRAVAGNWANLSPFRFLHQQGETKSTLDITPERSTSVAPPSDQNLQSSLSRVPELGRSMARAAYECGSGALANVLPATNKQVDVPAQAPPPSSDETASLTTLTLNSTVKRPTFLDEAAVVRFLRRITKNGFVLLYLQAPEGSGDDTNYTDDWKGRTVTMMIQKGQLATRGGNGESGVDTIDPPSPQLEWTTVTGGQTFESTTTSVSLLKILSIATNDDEMEDEDMCFFTVTSEDGEVHIFETATLEERDRIVNGLKTLIARWSFQVIAGDITATSELFESRGVVPSPAEDMPALPNPNLTLNSVAHVLLDSEG
jgi:hypothetical protein